MALSGALLQDAESDAQAAGIPTQLFVDQINQESSGNPNAVNGNAVGIAQFMPSTAAQFNLDPSDPVASLSAAAQYDQQLYASSGSWASVMKSYGTTAGGNGASVAAEAASIDAGNVSGAPASTTGNFISNILGSAGTAFDASNGIDSATNTPFVNEQASLLTGSATNIIFMVAGVLLILVALFYALAQSSTARNLASLTIPK